MEPAAKSHTASPGSISSDAGLLGGDQKAGATRSRKPRSLLPPPNLPTCNIPPMHPTPAPAPGILGLMASITPRPFAVALALSFKTIPCRTWKTQKNSRNPEQAVSGYVSSQILVLDSSILLNALLVPWTMLAPSIVLVRLSVSRSVSVSWCVGGGVGRGVSFSPRGRQFSVLYNTGHLPAPPTASHHLGSL